MDATRKSLAFGLSTGNPPQVEMYARGKDGFLTWQTVCLRNRATQILFENFTDDELIEGRNLLSLRDE